MDCFLELQEKEEALLVLLLPSHQKAIFSYHQKFTSSSKSSFPAICSVIFRKPSGKSAIADRAIFAFFLRSSFFSSIFSTNFYYLLDLYKITWIIIGFPTLSTRPTICNFPSKLIAQLIKTKAA